MLRLPAYMQPAITTPGFSNLPHYFGKPVSERVRSVMCNASVLRGSPESKASNLMRLLEEQGLKVAET